MYELDSLDDARRHCDAAVQLIDTYDLPATPDYYRLMYDYVSGCDPVVTRRLNDAAEDSNGRFQRAAADLIGAHYGARRMLNMVADMSEALGKEAGKAGDYIAEAGDSAHDFGIEIENLAGSQDIPDTPGAVRAMVEQLLLSTHRMQSKARKLESDLRQSTAEIMNLRGKLEETEKEALTDKLTALTNRAGFDRALTREMSGVLESGGCMSLVLCDIDHFKKFNDTYGHQVGDQVLKLVASLLRQGLKERDTPCRYGGEEFAVILPGADLHEARQVADRIRETIATRRIVRKRTGEEIARVTMSFGVSEYSHADTTTDLVERADEALYQSKRDGRNRVTVRLGSGVTPVAAE